MRVIVYGSLRQKQGNHHWMTYAQLLGEHKLEGYELYDLGYYPAVVKGWGDRVRSLSNQPVHFDRVR